MRPEGTLLYQASRIVVFELFDPQKFSTVRTRIRSAARRMSYNTPLEWLIQIALRPDTAPQGLPSAIWLKRILAVRRAWPQFFDLYNTLSS
jgi:hypothetical protein